MPYRSVDQDLDRLDRRMAAAAVAAQQTSEYHESMAMISRVLHDSAERHRDVVRVIAAIAGTTRLSDAHRLARDYLRSVA